MRQKRNVEDRRARQRLPDQLLDGEAALHCVNRNVAERVIDEMQRHIEVKDEAGRESDLAKAGHCGPICANEGKSSSMGSAQFGAQTTGRISSEAGDGVVVHPCLTEIPVARTGATVATTLETGKQPE